MPFNLLQHTTRNTYTPWHNGHFCTLHIYTLRNLAHHTSINTSLRRSFIPFPKCDSSLLIHPIPSPSLQNYSSHFLFLLYFLYVTSLIPLIFSLWIFSPCMYITHCVQIYSILLDFPERCHTHPAISFRWSQCKYFMKNSDSELLDSMHVTFTPFMKTVSFFVNEGAHICVPWISFGYPFKNS